MDMQDNEFDALFREKLNGFESEPSEKVWTGIDTELGDKKHSVPPWLSMAASIAVLVSIGILFIPKTHKIGHSGKSAAIVKPTPAATKPAEQVAVNTAPEIKLEPLKQEHKTSTERHKKAVIAVPAPVRPDETIAKNEPSADPGGQQAVIASVAAPKTDIVKQLLVPQPKTQLAVKPNIDTAINTTKPALIAKAVQPNAKPATPAVKKRGIRNFGELVNLVVAKVDKRKEKAVHFTDEDDGDGSTLTAVNIGPVRIGKEEQ